MLKLYTCDQDLVHEIHFCCGKLHPCNSWFVFLKFYTVIPTSWDVVITDSKTPSHSQAEELKADQFGVRADQNNCSSCIGAATTALQYMHLESMVQKFAYLLCISDVVSG